jgi:hypothetical protein
MVTKKQLNSIGYFPDSEDKNMYIIFGSWEYGFDISRQELWCLNDGVGEPEFEGKITDFKVLKDFLELKGEVLRRVSFDFDSTLSLPEIQKFAKELVEEGVEVWVVTSRMKKWIGGVVGGSTGEIGNNDLFEVTDKIGISRANIHFTEGDDKWKFLKDKGFAFHLDDCTIELELIEENTDVVPVCHFDWGQKFGGKEAWKKRCLESLEK